MNTEAPLAERMRPRTLDDLLGQEHLSGKGSILRNAIERGKIPSMILWGPPGTGKTTIANIIAHTLSVPFIQLSAISAGVKEVRESIASAQENTGTILFIDEIHRFNKGQQDALLGAVEKGIITLIGATTENPSFEVNSALLSRCQVYVLKSLGDDELIQLLKQAIEKDDILKTKRIELKETEALINISGGDARKLLNLFELVVEQPPLTPPTEENNAQPPLAQDSGEPHEEFFWNADPITYGLLKTFVSQHRKNATPAEDFLWQQLRNNKLDGYSFRRQHIIGNFIADFICLAKKLVIEVDGLAHQLPDNTANDQARTSWLNIKGFEVIRFTNDEVLSNIEKTIKRIQEKLKELPLAPKKNHNRNNESLTGELRSAGGLPPLGEGRDGGWITVTDDIVMKIAQQRIALYDKKGEQHYDIISAFIKSMRGSDPNAAVYWLARMVEGGEDVKFIARRMVIFASEDIGNANPTALVLANSTFEAVNKIGYPESQLILSQCVIYLASSAKSNSATTAIGAALDAIKKQGDLAVPLHLRNAQTSLMKRMGYGKNYKYAHTYEGNFTEQEFLPDEIKGTAFYEPGKNPREEELRKFLKSLWKGKYGY